MSAEANSVCVVVNPVSGIGKRRAFVEALSRRLRDHRFAVQTTWTAGPAEARSLARESCRGGCRALVVVGGDGTVNEVIQGLRGDGVPILAVPAGTENILAKYLGIEADVEWLCDVVRRGREARFDIAVMNDRRFLLVAGMGFDAEVVRRLVSQRRGHISRASYFWPCWRTFWGYRQPNLRVEADGGLLHVGPGLAFVGNIPRYAVNLPILQRARPDDRLLDVCVFPCAWQGPLLRHAVNVLLHRHIGRNGVVYRQARHVRVWSEQRVGIQLDGEWAGFGPAEFSVAEETVRFLVSSDWDAGRYSAETK